MQEREQVVLEIMEAIRQTACHYGLWLAESVHQIGLDEALKAEQMAGDRFFSILNRKLCKVYGRKNREQLFEGLDDESLAELRNNLQTSWLAADGVWFQAIERLQGMDDAKRINDTCWARFSPLEAHRIKDILSLPASGGGLEALKLALGHRMYSNINTWEIVEEQESSFVLCVNNCRVQQARKRKGLAAYPCKSGGSVEYRGFAREIDPRILTECIACPPDAHPDNWYCSWKFSLSAS